MIQLQQGAAYSDNQRDVSEAAFEADAVEVVIWTSFERPRGPRTLLEEINNYPTETTRRRPPLGYPRAELPVRRSRSVCWSRSDRLRDDRRRVTGKRPARTALNFTRL